MNFEDFLNESDAAKFYNSNQSLWLKHMRNAEVAESRAKRYPKDADEHNASAKEHRVKAEAYKKEMDHWAKIHAQGDM